MALEVLVSALVFDGDLCHFPEIMPQKPTQHPPTADAAELRHLISSDHGLRRPGRCIGYRAISQSLMRPKLIVRLNVPTSGSQDPPP